MFPVGIQMQFFSYEIFVPTEPHWLYSWKERSTLNTNHQLIMRPSRVKKFRVCQAYSPAIRQLGNSVSWIKRSNTTFFFFLFYCKWNTFLSILLNTLFRLRSKKTSSQPHLIYSAWHTMVLFCMCIFCAYWTSFVVYLPWNGNVP